MTLSDPIIYLLVGEDEYAISIYLEDLQAKLGNQASATLNLTRLDGSSFNPDELLSVAAVAPFLAPRRLVILTSSVARIIGDEARQRFLQQLEQIPPSTTLALVECSSPKASREKRKDLSWLKTWIKRHPEKALEEDFPLPKQWQMSGWIQEQARSLGGQITPQAALKLQELVGVNKRLAVQELHKLLAYANYQRPIAPEDVEKLVADAGQGNVFQLVDAVATGNRAQALASLQKLLEQDEPSGIFGMLVRQFRMLLVAREMLNQDGASQQLMKELRIHEFVAKNVLTQARQFSPSELAVAYHRLLDADERVKSGEMPVDLSLEILVVELTGKTPLTPIQK